MYTTRARPLPAHTLTRTQPRDTPPYHTLRHPHGVLYTTCSYLHDVVNVLDGTEPLRPQLQPRGHLQLREASLQVQLDAVACPPLPPAKTVRRLTTTSVKTSWNGAEGGKGNGEGNGVKARKRVEVWDDGSVRGRPVQPCTFTRVPTSGPGLYFVSRKVEKYGYAWDLKTNIKCVVYPKRFRNGSTPPSLLMLKLKDTLGSNRVRLHADYNARMWDVLLRGHTWAAECFCRLEMCCLKVSHRRRSSVVLSYVLIDESKGTHTRDWHDQAQSTRRQNANTLLVVGISKGERLDTPPVASSPELLTACSV